MPQHPVKLVRTAEELRNLVSGGVEQSACTCSLGACEGWDSLKEERWPAAAVRQVATLRDPELSEPTFEEHHPKGTRYESAEAPIAVPYFPYNRCDLWKCSQCQRHLLRYTEFGGYYVDHRVRALDAARIVD